MILAICLIMLGIILRLIAKFTLGEHFNLRIEKPQKIIRTGIYRYVKHPSYWGSLLIILGASILHPIAGIMLISWAFFYSRIVEENKFLKEGV